MSPSSVPLDSDGINALLNSSYWRVKVVESTGSTQIDLVKNVRDGVDVHGSVLATEYQSAGRGRMNRTFIAPPRSALLFSFYVVPGKGEWGWLPLLAGQSVVDAVSRIFTLRGGDTVSLKWPNDILLNDRKIAGLLAESMQTSDTSGVVIGIGINVHTRQEELPNPRATSFALEGYIECDRNALLAEILGSFASQLIRWENADPSLLQDYIDVSATIGRRVMIEMPGQEKFISLATSIHPSGALVLEDGRLITVGDVTHVSTH